MNGIELLERWRRKGFWFQLTSTDGYASEGYTLKLHRCGCDEPVSVSEEEFAPARAGGPDDTWIGFDALAAIAVERAQERWG